MRPAANTQPPTAWRMRESPVRLPVMKTFSATSSEVSAFARSVRPDICVGVDGSMGVGERISAWRAGETKSMVPRRPTAYSSPPTSYILDSPDVRRMVNVAVPVEAVEMAVTSAFGRPSYKVQSR